MYLRVSCACCSRSPQLHLLIEEALCFLSLFWRVKALVLLSIENNTFIFSKCEVLIEVSHVCLSSWAILEILNLLCKLFGTEILILLCLWTVLIPVATVKWVFMQLDANDFTDKVKLENQLSFMSLQFSSTPCWILLCTLTVRSKTVVLQLSISNSDRTWNVLFSMIKCDTWVSLLRNFVNRAKHCKVHCEENRRVPLVLCPSRWNAIVLHRKFLLSSARVSLP